MTWRAEEPCKLQPEPPTNARRLARRSPPPATGTVGSSMLEAHHQPGVLETVHESSQVPQASLGGNAHLVHNLAGIGVHFDNYGSSFLMVGLHVRLYRLLCPRK